MSCIGSRLVRRRLSWWIYGLQRTTHTTTTTNEKMDVENNNGYRTYPFRSENGRQSVEVGGRKLDALALQLIVHLGDAVERRVSAECIRPRLQRASLYKQLTTARLT